MKLVLFLILGFAVVAMENKAEGLDLCKIRNKKSCLNSCLCRWCHDADNKGCMTESQAHNFCISYSSKPTICKSLNILTIILISCALGLLPLLFCSIAISASCFVSFESCFCECFQYIYSRISSFFNDYWIKHREKGVGEPLIYGL